MDKRAYYRKSHVAEHYEGIRFSHSGGQRTHEVECEFVSSVFSKTDLVLDIACGTARVLRDLRNRGGRVIGVDQSIQMLDQSKTPQFLVQGNVFSLPFKADSFDGAYCMRFTNHYKSLLPLFTEVRRVIKSGGCFVFDTMRWSPLIWDYWSEGGKNYFHSPTAVRGLLNNMGFRVVRHSPLFLMSPYLVSGFPGRVVDWIQKLKKFIPWATAVEVWHVQKE
jgi:ubiquinone/menaquinone biosynthesis C-methylase UbiE